MSQGTFRILSLVKDKELTGSPNIPVRKYEGLNEVNHIDSLGDCDPISNWVLEVDPNLLKQKEIKREDIILSTENIDVALKLKNDNEITSQFYSYKNNFNEVNDDIELSTEPAQCSNKIITSEKKYMNSNEKINTIHNLKKVNILSHWSIGENGTKFIDISTGDPEDVNCLEPYEFESCVQDNKNQSKTTEILRTSNSSLPLIVIPPQELVEHLPLKNDIQIITKMPPNVESGINSNEGIKTNNRLVDSVNETICKEDLNDAERTMTKMNEHLQLNVKEEVVEITKKKHYQDKKTFCFYCEKDVSHFPRHLSTWHENEIEVQRILAYKCKSRERRNALSALGKRGNYVKNRSSLKLRPVKRVNLVDVTSTNDFLPCPHCLGFYKKKSLYRHSKRCNRKKELVNVRQNAQSDGQTALLLGTFEHEQLLKKELFPRMRADEITMIAKKDTLICNYAFSYMKGRRSKGNLDLVRQNVRRLAKLLLYAKHENEEVTELMDILCPTMFQVIINGVNKIGGYNHETDTYESPTVAINFGTLIKKCCDLAYIHLLQKQNTESRRKELKILKALVESQWSNEVSAQAASNLNSAKWNREELLPLTSDLNKLKNYLETTAEKMYENLQTNIQDQSAYNTLKEVIYTQIILMNRRRPAEVSQLKIQTYKSIDLDNQVNEFESCLTETEKILLNSCSRIVIRGKRGRGVPILLSSKMKEHFDFLVNIRDNFIKNNDFVFHSRGKSFIDGTQIVYKYAEKCGAENPKKINATRLRKYLATVTHLLQFSNSDLEQLSKFMGHTLKTHCDFYRLSDSMYQTAKISKLLLLATEGGLEKYKGMQLDEINIDLSPISEEYNLEDNLTSNLDIDYLNDSSRIKPKNVNTTSKHRKRICPKQPWTIEEKKIISKHFATHIERKKAPKQDEILNFMDQYTEIFKNRKWTSIKAVVYNIYTGKLNVMF